jgi:hypothetical protein
MLPKSFMPVTPLIPDDVVGEAVYPPKTGVGVGFGAGVVGVVGRDFGSG